MIIFFPLLGRHFPTPAFLLQLHYYQTTLPEWYMLNYGVREVWCIHPPNRIDLTDKITESFANMLLPVHYAASFDADTTNNITLAKEISRLFADETKWLLEDKITNALPDRDLLDVYGGWQSHLYCWERTAAYFINSRADIPVLILEDDVALAPQFLTMVKRILNNLPSDWRVLSLDRDNISCTANQYGVCRIDRFHLGKAYIIRDFYTAVELWKLNNNETPSILYDQSHRLMGWKPIVHSHWPGYVILNNDLALDKRYTTLYPHSPTFTPS